MKAFQRLESKVIYIGQDYLDNHDIMPGFFAMKTKPSEAGPHLFNNLRYLPGLPKKANPTFPLNQFTQDEAQVLIPGKFFATEMEAEAAVWGIQANNIKVVISNAFGSVFKRHAYHNGLLAIELAEEDLALLSVNGLAVIVDVENQCIEVSERIIEFEIDPDLKHRLMVGVSEVEETLNLYEDAITAYEQKWHFE